MHIDPVPARRLARLNGVARSVLGVAALVAPERLLAPWVGDVTAEPSAPVLGRALGGRDLAIGLGTLWAIRRDQPVAGWVAAGGLADAGDVVVTLARFSSRPRVGRWLVLGAAAAGVAAAVATAPSLRR
jgi:hypothetical protein